MKNIKYTIGCMAVAMVLLSSLMPLIMPLKADEVTIQQDEKNQSQMKNTPIKPQGELGGTGGIAVYVYNEGGKALAGAVVTVSGGLQGGTQLTNFGGYTYFDKLPFDWYTVTAHKIGYKPDYQWAQITSHNPVDTIVFHLEKKTSDPMSEMQVSINNNMMLE